MSSGLWCEGCGCGLGGPLQFFDMALAIVHAQLVDVDEEGILGVMSGFVDLLAPWVLASG